MKLTNPGSPGSLRDPDDVSSSLEGLFSGEDFYFEDYAIYFLVITLMVGFYLTVSSILGGASNTRNEARKTHNSMRMKAS